MFIEIAELIRCPQDHEETFCVISADVMEGRRVRTGIIGCPVCKNEYTIEEYVPNFVMPGEVLPPNSMTKPSVEAHVVQALLNLSGPGGNVVLVGSAAFLGDGLSALMDGIHYIGANVPEGIAPSAALSALCCPTRIPLKSSSMRGVVLGVECANAEWMEEARRVLLRGQRVVALSDVVPPDGISKLMQDAEVFVGEKC